MLSVVLRLYKPVIIKTMKNSVVAALLIALTASSCVSKKKYVALQDNYEQTQSALTKSNFEKEELQSKFARIEARVSDYNKKLVSLADDNSALKIENATKLDMLPGGIAMSSANRDQLKATIATMDPNVVAGAKTLKDSINLAINHNLAANGEPGSEDININVEETVVKISVSDKLLFNTASFRVNQKAYPLLGKLAEIIKSEPSMDVMVEGHTDSRTINTSVVQDNWDLSVKRATSITRILQNKFGVDPAQLIASGRSSYKPLVENTNNENRALNRRTQIIILPNMDKFFALMNAPSTVVN